MPKLALPLSGLWAVVALHLVYSARAEIAAPTPQPAGPPDAEDVAYFSKRQEIVTPAHAGVQVTLRKDWIPAFAGMTLTMTSDAKPTAPTEVPPADAAPASATARGENPAAENENGDAYAVPPPPFTPGIFPCSDCHAVATERAPGRLYDADLLKTNPKRRELTEEHTAIKLRHDEKNRWCLDCHNADNRDYLHLASGKLVDFNQSYLLCGQCHGPTLADWKVGVHGKRTGLWNGKKQYLLCAHCHNPHSPRFKPLKPLPPPLRPQRLR